MTRDSRVDSSRSEQSKEDASEATKGELLDPGRTWYFDYLIFSLIHARLRLASDISSFEVFSVAGLPRFDAVNVCQCRSSVTPTCCQWPAGEPVVHVHYSAFIGDNCRYFACWLLIAISPSVTVNMRTGAMKIDE